MSDSRIEIVTAPDYVDVSNSKLLRSMLYQALTKRPQGVLLDLRGTDTLDSSALGEVIGFHRLLLTRNICLALVLGSESNIMRLLNRTRLASIFTIKESMDSAMEVLNLC